MLKIAIIEIYSRKIYFYRLYFFLRREYFRLSCWNSLRDSIWTNKKVTSNLNSHCCVYKSYSCILMKIDGINYKKEMVIKIKSGRHVTCRSEYKKNIWWIQFYCNFLWKFMWFSNVTMFGNNIFLSEFMFDCWLH